MTKLTIKSDAELSAAVAEHVAGWMTLPNLSPGNGLPPNTEACIHNCIPIPPFATSADAVLPLLEKQPFDMTITYSDTCCNWTVNLLQRFTGKKSFKGGGELFPRAACLALLRAKGFEVKFAPDGH